jgi:chitodextrinase
MSYLAKAIQKLQHTAEFSFTNEDYATVKWDVLDGDAPTQSQIDSAIKAIKAEEKAEIKAKETAKAAILDRIGLTSDELKLLLG